MASRWRGKRMRKPSSAEEPRAEPDATRSGGFAGGVRAKLLQQLAGFAAAPILGLFAGFFLLFGGIFLAVAWITGPQRLIDSYRYAPFTAHATGHIIESWTAREFDPHHM